jgi:hypothetical protein
MVARRRGKEADAFGDCSAVGRHVCGGIHRILWTRHSFSGEGPGFDPLNYPNDYLVWKPKAHFVGKPIHYQGPDACEESSPTRTKVEKHP